MVRAGHRSSVPSGQQKQQSVPLERVIKVVAAVYGQCNLSFFK